jgi:hypothetical protein
MSSGELKFAELTEVIINAAMKVHRSLLLRFKEGFLLRRNDNSISLCLSVSQCLCGLKRDSS